MFWSWTVPKHDPDNASKDWWYINILERRGQGGGGEAERDGRRGEINDKLNTKQQASTPASFVEYISTGQKFVPLFPFLLPPSIYSAEEGSKALLYTGEERDTNGWKQKGEFINPDNYCTFYSGCLSVHSANAGVKIPFGDCQKMTLHP